MAAPGFRPWLVLVTGEPGSGKSDLGRLLAEALRVPYLSRDDVRHGIVATASRSRNRGGDAPEREVAVETFVRLVEQAATSGVSAVLEVIVFRGKAEVLDRLLAVADCIVVVVECSDAPTRAVSRDLADPLLQRPGVLKALGSESVENYVEATAERPEVLRAAMLTDFDLPVLRVRTDNGYEPSLPEVINWVVTETG